MAKFTCARCGNPLEFVDALEIERESLQDALRTAKAQIGMMEEEAAWRKEALHADPNPKGNLDEMRLRWQLTQAQAVLRMARTALDQSKSWDWIPEQAANAVAEIDALLLP